MADLTKKRRARLAKRSTAENKRRSIARKTGTVELERNRNLPASPFPTSSFNPGALPGGGFGLPGMPSTSFDVGGFAGAAASSGACDFLPSPLKEICQGAGVVLGKPSGQSADPGTGVDPCGAGSVKVGNTCVAVGDLFPGGAPGFSEAGGQAVIGSFGLPALTPTIVGVTSNSRGEVVPLRRCPTKMVLGTDNLCYPKAILPRRSNFRKHKGAPRPPMTASDAAALRRIGTLQSRVKDLAKDAGLSCKKR